MVRCVFLDRDGVVTRSNVIDNQPYAPTRLEDLQLLPGAVESMNSLKGAGFLLVIVTNQPDVAIGKVSRSVVESMHAKLRALSPVDDIRVCYHVDADRCLCRKPLPGMLISAAKDHGIDLFKSFMVGDRWRDIDAGHAAGCRTVFIDHGYRETLRVRPDAVVSSLPGATRLILAEMNAGC